MAKKKPKPDERPELPGPAGPDAGPPSPGPEPADEPEAPAPSGPKSKARPKAKAKAAPKRAPRAPSPPERARALLDQAGRARDPRRRLELARQAIEADPDCAEAHLLLAEHAKTRKEALAHYEAGVEAAARELGPGLFRDGEGHFWALPETRPYMTARLALAELLWTSGRRAEAAAHLVDMLRLNPGDNQGLRYTLASWLLSLDRHEALDALLAEYDEDSAPWAYTKALAGFRRSGDSPGARKALKAAIKANKHVPDYLLGRKSLPPEQPGYYSPGDEDDAILYVGGHLAAWKSTPGAIAWVRSLAKEPRRKKPKAPASVGPTPAALARVGRLPAEVDTWQADFRQFARRVEIAGERVRPWMVLVASRSRDLVLAHGLSEESPTPEALWDLLAQAMEEPAAGEPHRPTEIQVRPGPAWDALAGPLESIGVACSPTDPLDQVDFLFDDLTRHMAGVDPPGLLDMPGVTPEQVGRFFEAAAGFYRRAPWRSLGYEAVIRIECDRYESGPWFAVIMGQSGLTLGLALYEDLALLRRMWAGKLSDEEGARKTVALTATFDDESSMPEVDLEAIQQHGWEVAAPEAYPSVFRKERGLSMRPPLSWEIDLMDACLRVLPDFVARRAPDDPTRELVHAPHPAGPLELGLSWIEEPI